MTKHNNEELSWNIETDVVVIGAGGAGLAAAIESASRGERTLVIEKQPDLSYSSTALSAGMFAFAGTNCQKDLGINDTNELFCEDILNVGKRENDPELVAAYIEKQLDTYYWLEKMGVKWSKVVSAAAGMSKPRAQSTDPKMLIQIIKKKADSYGMTFVFNAKATGLITCENERVCGVSVQTDRRLNIRAKRGVILASGGFAHNVQMLASIDKRFEKVAATAGVGHTGDGHTMAEELGAYMKDLMYVKPSFELHVSGTSVCEILLMFFLGAVIVNKEGKRFVNESISYKDIGMASLEQPEAVGYQIFDKNIFNVGVEKAESISESISPKYYTLGLDKTRIDLLVQADTLEELAVKIGIPPKALVNTVNNYNKYVDSGRDIEFNRSSLSGSIGKPVKIDKAPYFSFETKSHFLATYAGIAVDKNMNVLCKNSTFSGLYAAGEIIGGFHGASYHTGTALGKAIIFGRVAGINVVKNKKL